MSDTELDTEPRRVVGFRLRPASIDRVAAIARRDRVRRAEVYRLAFKFGIDRAEEYLDGKATRDE